MRRILRHILQRSNKNRMVNLSQTRRILRSSASDDVINVQSRQNVLRHYQQCRAIRWLGEAVEGVAVNRADP